MENNIGVIMEKFKFIQEKLAIFISNIKMKTKMIVKNINTPSYENFIYLSYLFLFVTLITYPIFSWVPNEINIEYNDLLFNIYLGLSTLMIPLALFIAQKISDSKEVLIADIYRKQSYIFPIIIFQIDSFVALLVIHNFLYYCMLIIIYAIFLILIYIKTLRLFSDNLYFSKKLKEEIKKIINNDLELHIGSHENASKNERLLDCGIYFENYHYESTDMYEREYIYPTDDDLFITELNKRELRNLVSIMTQLNIKDIDISKENSKETLGKKKVLMFLQNEGYTTRVNTPIIRIFYNSKFPDVLKQLETIKTISYNLYKYENYNLDIIIRKELEEAENKCTVSICNHSITELENNLKAYTNFYKALVDNIDYKINKDYNLKDIRKALYSLNPFKGFKYFEYINRELYNLCNHPNTLGSKMLFNEITSCIYEMLLYSYTKNELISFEYTANTYHMLSIIVNENKILDMNKIQLELFEILNLIYYGLKNSKNENYQSSKNMIILLNVVIVDIMFDLATKNIERYYMFRKKFVKFISNVEQEIEEIISPQNIIDVLQEILINCSSNLFAMDSYIFNKTRDKHGDNILDFYNNKSFKYILSAFLYAHKFDFDSIYHWDKWEGIDVLNADGAHWVKTGSYLNSLFCNICLKHNSIDLPTDRDLVSFYNSSLKNTFLSLGCDGDSNLILKFENMVEEYNQNGKKYLRETNISPNKEKEFKEKFISCYNKDNNLYKLMKKYNNIKIVTPSKGEVNYLGISQIIEKTFLLDKMPNDENIIFSGFESNFVESFINGEEKRYVKDVLDKLQNSKEDILNVLKSIENVEEILIFANYTFDYKLYDKLDIKHQYIEGYKCIDKDNDLYVLYKDVLIPVYQIKGINKNSFYILNSNRMGKFCRDKENEYFNINIIEYSNNSEQLQKTMRDEINGCDLKGEEKKNHLLECVNLIIREYVKFDNNAIDGYKLYYNNCK